jgi:hypothetical protein
VRAPAPAISSRNVGCFLGGAGFAVFLGLFPSAAVVLCLAFLRVCRESGWRFSKILDSDDSIGSFVFGHFGSVNLLLASILLCLKRNFF